MIPLISVPKDFFSRIPASVTSLLQLHWVSRPSWSAFLSDVFLQETKHVEIAGRNVRAVERMIKLFPLELCSSTCVTLECVTKMSTPVSHWLAGHTVFPVYGRHSVMNIGRFNTFHYQKSDNASLLCRISQCFRHPANAASIGWHLYNSLCSLSRMLVPEDFFFTFYYLIVLQFPIIIIMLFKLIICVHQCSFKILVCNEIFL